MINNSMIQILVAVDVMDEFEIQRLADKLIKTGMKVDEIMPLSGTIAGSIAFDQLPTLKALSNVVAVETDQILSILPITHHPIVK